MKAQRYSSTLSLTSALHGGGWLTPRHGRFTLGKRPGTHSIGGCMGLRAGLAGTGKFRPHRDSVSETGVLLLCCLFAASTVEPLITDTVGEFKFCPL
jgi:hypothetical protein